LREIRETNTLRKNEDHSRSTAAAQSDVSVVDRTSALPVVQTKFKGKQKVSAVESFVVPNLTEDLADELAEVDDFNAVAAPKRFR
jgi:hypothetical protein